MSFNKKESTRPLSLSMLIALLSTSLVTGCGKDIDQEKQFDAFFENQKNKIHNEREERISVASKLDKYQISLVPYDLEKEPDGENIKSTYVITKGSTQLNITQARAILDVLSFDEKNQVFPICTEKESIRLMSESNLYSKEVYLNQDKEFVAEKTISAETCSNYRKCLENEGWKLGENPSMRASCEKQLFTN